MSLLKKDRSPAEMAADKTRKVAKKVKKAVSGKSMSSGTFAKGAAAAGIAAATAVGAAALWKARSDGKSDGLRLHVVSDGNGSWHLKREGRDDPIHVHESKRAAISAAREYAREHTPSVLAIHREDGEITREHSYTDD